MILCATLQIEVEGLDHLVILPCRRHGEGLKIIADLSYASKTKYKVLKQGFLTHTNEFLDRQEALKHARICGQLPVTVSWYKEDNNIDELYSEDLY